MTSPIANVSHHSALVPVGYLIPPGKCHYNDVIMGTIASQITSLANVYSIVYSDGDQRNTSKLRVTGLCAGNSTGTGEFPAQMVSCAENVSIWWRHHHRPRFQLETRNLKIVLGDENHVLSSWREVERIVFSVKRCFILAHAESRTIDCTSGLYLSRIYGSTNPPFVLWVGLLVHETGHQGTNWVSIH